MTRLTVPAALAVLALAAGCGGSAGHQAAPAPTTARASGASTEGNTTSSSGGSPGALQAEATAAAAGDIPDNQVFVIFRNGAAGYVMKYPEGWAQQGSGERVSFRDRNNIVRIVVAAGTKPTKVRVQAEVARSREAQVQSPPQAITLSGWPAFKIVYSTESAPNAVTGKRVKLVVDRYYLWKAGRRASRALVALPQAWTSHRPVTSPSSAARCSGWARRSSPPTVPVRSRSFSRAATCGRR